MFRFKLSRIMTYEEAVMEAQNKAFVETEEECSNEGIALLDEDDNSVYSFQAKRIFENIFKTELKRLVVKHKIKRNIK